MKKRLMALITGFVLLCMTGMAGASLTTIGTASYDGSNYNLIYDDDDTGYGGGGLVWLDYTNSGNWADQVSWASGLGSFLTVTLNPGYTTDIDWTTGWRLPETVDGTFAYGYQGDPNDDGIYSYTYGYNLANSEMGHLFYTELGNLGYYDTNGNDQSGYGLQNTGDFDNLIATSWYWSGTEYAVNTNGAWHFFMVSGYQDINFKSSHNYGLAVHSGQVSAAPVPVPATMLLLGSGLIGLAGARRKFKK